jgi:hypothetical protein
VACKVCLILLIAARGHRFYPLKTRCHPINNYREWFNFQKGSVNEIDSGEMCGVFQQGFWRPELPGGASV